MKKHRTNFWCACLVLSTTLSMQSTVVPAQEKVAAAQSNVVNAREYKQLKGGVKVLLLTLSDLRAIGHDVRRAQNAVREISREVSRKPLEANPDVPNEVAPIIVESKDKGYLQPRERLLKHYLSQLNVMLGMMHNDVQRYCNDSLKLVFRKDVQEPCRHLLEDEWAANVKKCREHVNTLSKLSQKPPYNNEALIAVAKQLSGDLKELRRIQRQLIKAYKKERSKVK